MPNPNNWTRQQTLAALHVYFQLPFGQLHQRNPRIKQLAQWIGRTPGSVALKLVNFASLPERFKPDEAFLTAHAQRFGFL